MFVKLLISNPPIVLYRKSAGFPFSSQAHDGVVGLPIIEEQNFFVLEITGHVIQDFHFVKALRNGPDLR